MRCDHIIAVLSSLVLLSTSAEAADYRCEVERKFHPEEVYTADHLQRAKFSVLVEDRGDRAFLSRCSYSSLEKKVTCDRYEADRIAFDNHVKIKKYYDFSGQFDMQIFPDLSFIENNGRGSIAFGKCVVTSP